MRELENYKLMNGQYNLQDEYFYCEDDIRDKLSSELEERVES